MPRFSCLIIGLFLLFPGVAGAQSAGVAPAWDARTMLHELTEQTNRFDPLLDQVATAGWGESAEAYAGQVKALRKELSYLRRAATELAAHPDTMTKTLETYLRLQAVEAMMNSVIDGVRRHQNPAVADLLQEVLNEIGPYGQHLQDYLVQLVGMKEAELKIATSEAQRCRAEIIKNKKQ